MVCISDDKQGVAMHKITKVSVVAVFMLFAGCVSVDLQSSATKLVHSKKSDEYFQNTYTGNWWNKSPQQVLDEQLQSNTNSEIEERGLWRVTCTQTWSQVLMGISCLGFRTPVYVTWWLEK